MKKLKNINFLKIKIHSKLKMIFAKSNVNDNVITYTETVRLLQQDPKWSELLNTELYTRVISDNARSEEDANFGVVGCHMKPRQLEFYAIDIYEYKNNETGESVCAVYIAEVDEHSQTSTSDAELIVLQGTAKEIANKSSIDGIKIIGHSGKMSTAVQMIYQMCKKK